jgi:hypothetical protein
VSREAAATLLAAGDEGEAVDQRAGLHTMAQYSSCSRPDTTPGWDRTHALYAPNTAAPFRLLSFIVLSHAKVLAPCIHKECQAGGGQLSSWVVANIWDSGQLLISYFRCKLHKEGARSTDCSDIGRKASFSVPLVLEPIENYACSKVLCAVRIHPDACHALLSHKIKQCQRSHQAIWLRPACVMSQQN